MPIVTISKSRTARAAWHREIITGQVAKRLLEDGTLNEFPPAVLQLTKEYRERKKLQPNTNDCDKHLNDLVKEHVQREYGNVEVAVLACLLEFSPFTAVAALISLRGDGQSDPSYSKYLRCLIAAHDIGPMYVSENEAQVAACLLQIRLGYAHPLAILNGMVPILAAIPSSQVLPAWYINKLLTFCRIPESYDVFFTLLQSKGQFASLYRSVSWAAEYLPPKQCLLAQDVLQAQIPQLSLWATWKPDEMALQQWESYAFTPEQMVQLRPVFQLEGPDTTGSGKPTFKDAEPACFGALSFNPETSDLVLRLLQLFTDMVQIGPSAVSLFIRMCVETTITDETLGFCNKLAQTGSDKCCQVALDMNSAFTPEASVSTRLVALANVIPSLQSDLILRELFGEDVLRDIVITMNTAQEMYCTQLSGNLGDNLGNKIQALGSAVTRSAWLQSVLPPEFLAKMAQLPSDALFRDITARLEYPLKPETERILKSYLSATLSGTENSDSILSLKAAVEAEQEFWVTYTDVERNRIFAIICKMPYIDNVEFLRACQAQIQAEDLVLIRDLEKLVERDTNMSCVDILRILGRRLELPCDVHDVWISLVFLMLKQRADEILSWACDNLTVKAWFRWVSDIRIVFAGREEKLLLTPAIGFTSERQQWWSQLSGDYGTSVEFLDQLQRQQSGGLASMRWLYLQEIPHTSALLDVLSGRQKLDYDHRWIMAFFQPKPDTISTLCLFLFNEKMGTQYGRQGSRKILERLYRTNPWPESATQAYMSAWLGHRDLTDVDKEMLNLLAKLMGITPSLNAIGLEAIKEHMLKEYDGVIEDAREVEGMRIQLTRHSSSKTTALAKRIGMQGLRQYIDPDIPERLTDAVESVGIKEYELCFPLTHIHGHDRKARGIGSDLYPLLIVRVLLEGEPAAHGFCIHLTAHEKIGQDKHRLQASSSPSPSKPNHTYWQPQKRSDRKKPASQLCTTNFNLFTHAVAQRLHRHFLKGPVSLGSIHDVVTEMIKRPAAECTSCGTAMQGLWKPTICTNVLCITEMSRSSLLVRAYGLLIDAPVLDFLLTCLYAASKDTSGLRLVTTDCPFDKTKLATVIDSFPYLKHDDAATPFDVLNRIRTASSELRAEREQLLAWMSKWFRGCMLSAPAGKRVPNMAEVEQFLLFNSTPECEKAFNEVVQSGNGSSHTKANSPARTGSVVFHGSQIPRLWKVLTEGLRNMSNTRYMAHGAVNGPGIYLADEPSTSFSYSGVLTSTWSRCAFAGKKVLLGCELEPNPSTALPAGAKRPPAGTHIVTDESRVLVRYVFICPANYLVPPARHVDMAMKSTFAALRSGP